MLCRGAKGSSLFQLGGTDDAGRLRVGQANGGRRGYVVDEGVTRIAPDLEAAAERTHSFDTELVKLQGYFGARFL